MSKFDQNRPDRKYKREMKVDFVRENAFELIRPAECVTNLISMNFKNLCNQHLPYMEKATNLNRRELIHLYT
jgi:hypothetical protein